MNLTRWYFTSGRAGSSGYVAIHRLPRAQIRAGATNAEIGRSLGTSAQSVNNMIHRARQEGFDMPYREDVA